MKIPHLLTLATLLGLLGACGGDAPPPSPSSSDEPAHAHNEGPHGGHVVVASDHSAHFEILHDAEAMRVDLYLLDAHMKPVGVAEAPVLNLVHGGRSIGLEGQGSADHWVFSDERLGREPQGRLRVRIAGRTYQVPFEHGHDEHGHDEHGHEHEEAAHGPHDGVVAAFGPSAGEQGASGWLELKLHDDLGDLELWLSKDEGITQPFDLPVDATLTVLFHDKAAREVILAVRDREKNEDEDGVANLRDGRTNYFIFPGETGEDAKWLRGAAFASRVTVSFAHDGATCATKVFELRPHTHGAHDHEEGHDGHEGHDHDEGHGDR